MVEELALDRGRDRLGLTHGGAAVDRYIKLGGHTVAEPASAHVENPAHGGDVFRRAVDLLDEARFDPVEHACKHCLGRLPD